MLCMEANTARHTGKWTKCQIREIELKWIRIGSIKIYRPGTTVSIARWSLKERWIFRARRSCLNLDKKWRKLKRFAWWSSSKRATSKWRQIRAKTKLDSLKIIFKVYREIIKDSLSNSRIIRALLQALMHSQLFRWSPKYLNKTGHPIELSNTALYKALKMWT